MTTETTTADDLILYRLLDQAAAQLHHNLSIGYTPDYERQLAAAVIGTVSEAIGADALLAWLVKDHMLDLVNIDCLLDDTDEGSYTIVQGIAETLLTAIHAQQRERDATRELVVAEIVARSRRED
ncbi:MAG TPA: hypothetical protein VJT31_37215 [Rugosimonospora sp.]|nr:hypothetical protein [Rugosimonospora sp.]